MVARIESQGSVMWLDAALNLVPAEQLERMLSIEEANQLWNRLEEKRK
jgi:hypothetical protein